MILPAPIYVRPYKVAIENENACICVCFLDPRCHTRTHKILLDNKASKVRLNNPFNSLLFYFGSGHSVSLVYAGLYNARC